MTDMPFLQFERGTITYMLTASVTRPTTISPVAFKDQKIYFVEQIDISPLIPPKPRTITLEPVPKKSRASKKSTGLSDGGGRVPGSSASGRTRMSTASSLPSTPVEQESVRSPSPSERSLESGLSSNGAASTSASARQSQRTSDSGTKNTSKASSKDRTITATVESLAGGCLRGDTIVVKISIDHTKHIKSLNGVILTLYRQARADMHPALPLGPTSEGEKRKYEDYYPKSVTGLGGLSLSGAGSSHIFRKDLAQVFMPLIVDPQTLSADIQAKIRVPEEAFPTISTVPGAMISFKYYIEAVIDIQAKLPAQSRAFPQNGGEGVLPGHPIGQGFSGTGSERNTYIPYGSSMVDTTPIRRDKSVITCVFEVIVGTLDSERRKGKRRAVEPSVIHEAQNRTHEPEQVESEWHQTQQPQSTEYDWGAHYWHQYHSHQSDDMYTGGTQYDQSQNYDYTNGYGYSLPPPITDEEGLSEKERLRRAEARLLPSQPPTAAQYQAAEAPSAPVLSEEEAEHQAHTGYSDDQSRNANQHIEQSQHFPDSGTLDYPVHEVADGEPSSSGYQGEVADPRPPSSDDKQEMQRRELQLKASAPPVNGINEQTGPSAPMLHDEDDTVQLFDGNGSTDSSRDHPLPRYER